MVMTANRVLPPSYVPPPAFSASSAVEATQQQQQHQQRFDRRTLSYLPDTYSRQPPSQQFVKLSKGGDVRLCLSGQDPNASLPVYGIGAVVDGSVEFNTRPTDVTSVEVKVEGRLKMKEMGEGGASSAQLYSETVLLWVKGAASPQSECPTNLSFRVQLPETFTHAGKTYALPPTYNVKLSGLPGFFANIEYSVSTMINSAPASMVPIVKSALLRLNGNTILSTPFIYYPRTCPSHPSPSPLRRTRSGFIEDPHNWRPYDSVIRSRLQVLSQSYPSPSSSSSSSSSDLAAGPNDISVRLYIPASRTFSRKDGIPFHLMLSASAHTLALYLPYGPMATLLGQQRCTRIQVMRQASVDVRSEHERAPGTKTDIWRVDSIGEGVFRHAGDGPTWIAFSGEIPISGDDHYRVTGFKAGGLTVKDCISLSITPPEPQKSPFYELRQVIPIRLTTDSHSAVDAGGVMLGEAF